MGDYVWGVDHAADWGQDLSPMQDSYNYNSGDFWENDSVWDNGWDSVFSDTQGAILSLDNMSNDIDSMFADNEDLYAFDGNSSESIGDKLINFAGSKNGLSLLGGALVGGMNQYSQNKQNKVSEKSREEERKFQEELQAQKEAHDEKMLAMQLASQDRSSGVQNPGTAEKTTTALGSHKVRW